MKAALGADPLLSITLVDAPPAPLVPNVTVAPCCARTAAGTRRQALGACAADCAAATTKAAALATLLTPAAEDGTRTYPRKVVVQVSQAGVGAVPAGPRPATTAEAARLLRQALLGNPYFARMSDYNLQ
ncbi:hypothetical protein ABPG75_004218 [Micractinium tetrahymenae]